jgi:methionine-rich copper-binding protein CopC
MKPSNPLAALALLVVTAAAAPPDRTGELHFGLRTSSPEAGASVAAPEAIRLTFTEVPQDNSVAVRLVDPTGELVETGEPTYDADDRTIIHVSVGAPLPAGGYTVAWRGIGDDGHVVRGDFSFSVTAQ